MAQPLSILIVEDETALAEMHAEFLRQRCSYGQVWLAGNLAQARVMIARFRPSLILLDNFLPDGNGITLLHELTAAHSPCGVVFTTAASDMDTVAEAVRCGVFDYLIKPISWSRLEQTLDRYQQRLTMLANPESASQRQIDEMFNAYARDAGDVPLPAGIDALTLAKVSDLFIDCAARHTAETVAQALKLSRTTARRYLEFAAGQQRIRADIVYGKVGRPQRIYRSSSPD
ncbi:two-component response regulator DpiA [Erwinia sp. JUb26]|uniref:two-component response regulator DpiA n=1 Tax=Erwinia sp. JUb26 TaxID=2485126 RepID=UPI000F48DE81|nr:two-component response regulator DpiA [Erwinia sp. JUb26]ROR14743.1 two-component system response regulator CitB [Erwinia sp. JUb26]